MKRFIEEHVRTQSTLLPDTLDDYVAEDNPVRVIEAFVTQLDLPVLVFGAAASKTTGRPGYHPATLLKLYIYGYLNRIQSSRRLEREAQRNLELIWFCGRLVPDFKTIPAPPTATIPIRRSSYSTSEGSGNSDIGVPAWIDRHSLIRAGDSTCRTQDARYFLRGRSAAMVEQLYVVPTP